MDRRGLGAEEWSAEAAAWLRPRPGLVGPPTQQQASMPHGGLSTHAWQWWGVALLTAAPVPAHSGLGLGLVGGGVAPGPPTRGGHRLVGTFWAMAESPRYPRLGPGFRMGARCPPTGAGFWVGTGGKGARVPAWDAQGCGAACPASESPAQHTGLRSDPSAGRGTYERGRGHGPTEQPSPAGQPGGRGDRDRKGERQGHATEETRAELQPLCPAWRRRGAERPPESRQPTTAEALLRRLWLPPGSFFAPARGLLPGRGLLSPRQPGSRLKRPFGWGEGFSIP